MMMKKVLFFFQGNMFVEYHRIHKNDNCRLSILTLNLEAGYVILADEKFHALNEVSRF
jgi:uncharacterized membrane protein YobD (UPF0266 family)